jgi:hypothetical protein
VPLAITLTGAHVHDSKVFEDLIDSIVPVKGKRGKPRRRPEKLHAHKGYDFPRCRRFLRKRGIKARIARRGVESSETLGRHRWVVERTLTVGSRAHTNVAFSLQASLRTLRTAGGHSRGFLSSLLRAYLPQLSQTCVLKRTLSMRGSITVRICASGPRLTRTC